MINDKDYSIYLSKRSFIGGLYRNFILYPRLCGYLTGSVLDVGCGIGDMLMHRPNTVGVDVNPFNIEICINRGLDARIMEIDSIPFQNHSFDCVLLDNVLEHIYRPKNLLIEANRVLRLGGLLMIGVPGNRGYQSDPDHKIFYDEMSLISMAGEHGFSVVKQFHMPLFKSSWLSKILKQYCIYSVWRKL